MNDMSTQIAPAPVLQLTISDAYGYVSFGAESVEQLFEHMAHRSEQLAAYAAATTAPLATTAPAPSTADSTSGSEARPARKRKPGADQADVEAGKGGSGAAEVATEEVVSAADEPAAASDSAANDDDAAVTYEDVRGAVVGLAAAKGRDAAIAVLDQFGVDHASKLTEAQWPEALAALTDAKGVA